MKELVDIDLLLRFIPKTGKSIAVAADSDDLDNEPIFLPLSQIEYQPTIRFEGGKRIIKVTMPEQLAIDKGLV